MVSPDCVLKIFVGFVKQKKCQAKAGIPSVTSAAVGNSSRVLLLNKFYVFILRQSKHETKRPQHPRAAPACLGMWGSSTKCHNNHSRTETGNDWRVTCLLCLRNYSV